MAAGGRGSAWFVSDGDDRFVLRHFRRGGLVGKVLTDQYVSTGAEKSRALQEFVLLDRLHCLGLPVPEPVAARYVRRGLFYRADLLTVRLDNTRTLAERLIESELQPDEWEALGALIRRFHQSGAYHADLNASNILCGAAGEFYLIDFDRGELRAPGEWCYSNLSRLKRSLDKFADASQTWHADDDDWQCLLAAYEAAGSSSSARSA